MGVHEDFEPARNAAMASTADFKDPLSSPQRGRAPRVGGVTAGVYRGVYKVGGTLRDSAISSASARLRNGCWREIDSKDLHQLRERLM